jgi:hypothetical protein
MPEGAEETFIYKMHDPGFKGALGEPWDFVMRKSNGTSFNILSEPLSTTPIVMYFPKNSYLTKTFSDWIQLMLASGLIEFWIKVEKSIEGPSSQNNGEPKVMTIQDLLAPFVFCTGGLLISAIVFVSELIFHAYKVKTSIRTFPIENSFKDSVISFKL